MKKHLPFAGLLFLFFSCVTNEFDPPDTECAIETPSINTNIFNLRRLTGTNVRQYANQDTLAAWVISSDQEGNFFKELILQSENGYGLNLELDATGLFTQFEPGRKVFLNLKDRYLQFRSNQLTVGDLFENQVGRISSTKIAPALQASCESKTSEELITDLSIAQISDTRLNTLVRFSSLQFSDSILGLRFYESQFDLGGATNHLATDPLGYRLVVRTSSFADFANEPLPEGRFSITGVLTKFGDTYQLLPRFLNDFKIESGRTSLDKIGIGALHTFEEDTAITEDYFIEGVVTLSGYPDPGNVNQQNLTARNAIMQDETGAIVLRFDEDAHRLVEGDHIKIYLKGYNTDTRSGIFQIETLDFDGENQRVRSIEIVQAGVQLPTPQEISIEDLKNGKHQSEIIRLSGFQFSNDDQGQTFKGTHHITNCTDQFKVATRSAALFSGNILPSGNGQLTAITTFGSGEIRLLLRNSNTWINMNSSRCKESELIFTENFETLIDGGSEGEPQPAGWQNWAANQGDEMWEFLSFSDNQYAQASAFGTNAPQEIWLVSPPLQLQNYRNVRLLFNYTQNFFNGDVLSVFISQNYNGQDPQSAQWQDLSSLLGVLEGDPDGFMNGFLQAPAIPLPDVSGTAHLAFIYLGSGTEVSTNIQIDEISIRGIRQ